MSKEIRADRVCVPANLMGLGPTFEGNRRRPSSYYTVLLKWVFSLDRTEDVQPWKRYLVAELQGPESGYPKVCTTNSACDEDRGGDVGGGPETESELRGTESCGIKLLVAI
jgi:hypothetical protein